MIKYKCLSRKKSYSNKIDEELKKLFNNNFKLFDNDINVFVLLLRKGVCLYEFMDKWETLNETSLSKRKIFILT